jgi:hypothetical protein
VRGFLYFRRHSRCVFRASTYWSNCRTYKPDTSKEGFTMSNFALQVFMTILVWVNNLDSTEFRYWFAIPVDVESYIRILKEKIKLPIAEIKAELWEDMFCAMSDRHVLTDSEILKKIGKAHEKIYSVTVEVCTESMTHKSKFRKELLPENSDFRRWSPDLQSVIEEATAELGKDVIGILIAIADAFYSDSEGGGDPCYELRRNNQSKQAGD